MATTFFHSVTCCIPARKTGSVCTPCSARSPCGLDLVVLLDGNLASASLDKTIRIWNMTNELTQRILLGHKSFVTCLAVLPNGDLASGSWEQPNSTIRIWDVNTGLTRRFLTGHIVVVSK